MNEHLGVAPTELIYNMIFYQGFTPLPMVYRLYEAFCNSKKYFDNYLIFSRQ